MKFKSAYPTRNSVSSCAMLCGMLGVLCTTAPGRLLAQAPAGPMVRPPSASEQPASPSPATSSPRTPKSSPQDKPAPRQNLGGSWNFNAAASDDFRTKIDEARRGGGTQQPGNAPVGGNGPYGGGPWGGGGYPFPGSGGPYGGGPGMGRPNNTPRGGYGDENDQSPAMREYVYPAAEVTFILKDNEADLTDDAARKRVFFTDGRKLQKSKDDNYREIAAHWEGSRLTADERLAGGERVRRVFELSSDGRQLNEEIDLDATRARGALTLRYVYDINTNRQ